MVPEQKVIRILFSKTGRMQFISHLDLCRTMRSALSRAKIPVKYTEGFNPHMKMTFALPLSIGAQSECEFMDLTLTEARNEAWLCQALQAQLPPEMEVKSVATPIHTYQEIGWASYRMTFSCEQVTQEALTTLLSNPIYIKKKNKRGEEKEVDLTPSIASFSVQTQDGEVVLEALLRADNAGYCNPEHLAKASGAKDYSILRTGVYLADKVTPFR